MTTTTIPIRRSAETRDQIVNILARTWSLVFLLGMIIFFSATGPGFLTVRNISNILVSSTLVMLMSIGQTYVIITAGIDLSLGWTVGLASVVGATTMRNLANGGMEPVTAIGIGAVAGLAVSLIPGLVNGVLVAKIKVPPFIATLGMLGVIRGAAFLLTDGQNVVGNLPSAVRDSLRVVGNGSLLFYVPDAGFTWFSQPPDLSAEQLRTLQKLAPYPVLIVAAVVIIFAFILGRTQFGRHTYAIGGSKDAALRAGINVDRHLLLIYVLAAFTAGIAGVMHIFRFTAGSPLAGEQALLDSVAAVVIGGTNLFGGEGRLSGSVIGALIIAVLQTGLVILAVDALWQFVVVGIIIIIAVLVNQFQAYLERQKAHE